ncbi:MAG: 4-phosphopantetheinyl transferase [Acidobacteriota bacterium]|nr:4-phosphopantetheinyl transferase [Acidobacteriota bacterium]
MLLDRHTWHDAPERPIAVESDLHVWRIHLDQCEAVLHEFSKFLSADEMLRADKFHFRRDRDHFVAARGALRDILGGYVGLAPGLLRFSYERYGKPALSRETGDELLRFNLSHSHGLALCAVTRGREVGIDLELIREDSSGMEIAERFFSPREVSALRALPPSARTSAFFDCWTRKEAYIKALGEGLTHPLQGFTVSLTPGEPAALLCADDPLEAGRWSLFELFPGAAYRAALAVEGEPPALHCWRYPESGPPHST